jgi:hypothetical protein
MGGGAEARKREAALVLRCDTQELASVEGEIGGTLGVTYQQEAEAGRAAASRQGVKRRRRRVDRSDDHGGANGHGGRRRSRERRFAAEAAAAGPMWAKARHSLVFVLLRTGAPSCKSIACAY